MNLQKESLEKKGRRKRVLIIGLDGMRADVWQYANTPNLDKLAKNGVYSTDAMTELDSVSGACWTSLLKGVHRDKHGVVGNDFSNMNRQYPTIFRYIRDYSPDYKASGFSNWRPILKYIFEKNVLYKAKSGNDFVVSWRAQQEIRKGASDLIFVQLDDCDHAGHRYGYSSEVAKYVEQVERTDKNVGMIISALDHVSSDEEWLVAAVSDHGGNGRSHGGVTYGELNIVFIISSDRIVNKGKIIYNEDVDEDGTLMPQIVDIFPTILDFLGIPKPPHLDGISRASFE